MILLSFEDLQKIRISPKFQRRSSKIVPATPILILDLSRAWQPQFLSYGLEILVSRGSFMDKQMMFYKDSSILKGCRQFSKTWFSFLDNGLLIGISSQFLVNLPIRRPLSEKKKQVFEKCRNPVLLVTSSVKIPCHEFYCL